MALSADDAAKLQQKLQEIERLSRLLGANINTINLQPLEENAGNIEAIFQRLTNQANGLGEETDYLVSNFQKLVGEIKKSGTGINESTKGLRALSSIAEQVSNYQKGYNDLSSKEIAKLRDKTKIETDRLKIAKNILKEEAIEASQKIRSGNLTPKQLQAEQEKLAKIILSRKDIKQLLQNEDITLGELNNKLKEAEKNAKRIENALGITGKTLKGISKIPILGDLVDTQEALKAATDAAKDGAGKIGTMGAAFKSLGKSLVSSLSDPLVAGGLLVSIFKKIVELGFRSDTQVTNLSKSMAISKNQASALRDRFIEIQNSGDSLFETTQNLVAAQLELADAFGATQGFTEQQVRDQVYLTKQIGLSADEAAGLQQLAMANGKTAKEVNASIIKQTASLARQTGIQLDNKKILGEVAKVSGQIRLQYQNNPELIAKAVVQTQKLGITLEQAAKQARHLLNFEESISDQISAELLTGKELNLERARLLALNGDIAGASAEILSQVGSAAEFSAMNVIQQEALAKAAGMTADELANSLIQQENLSRLGSKTKKQIQAQVEELRRKGKVEEANQLMASIGNEKEALAALEEISAQEKFNLAVEKLQAMLASIVEGPMGKFLDKLVTFISKTENLKAILATIKGIMFGMAVAFAIMNPLAAGLGLAAAASVYALSNTEPTKLAKGGIITSRIDNATIGEAGPEAVIPLNSPQASSYLGKTETNTNIDVLIREQQKTNEILTKLYSKEGNVYQDSYKVGITQNMATYRV